MAMYPYPTNVPLEREYGGTVVRVGQVTVAQVPILLFDRNTLRLGANLTNTSANTIYVGPDSTVSTTTGHAVLSGQSLSFESQTALYAIAATGSNIVTAFEEMR